jgi:hypothetical protein
MSATLMTCLPPAPTDRLGRLRAGAARVGVHRIAALGFVAAMAWAFAGSLLLGLSSRPGPDAVTAWAWLGGEALIGVATLAGLLLAPASRRGASDGEEEDRPARR